MLWIWSIFIFIYGVCSQTVDPVGTVNISPIQKFFQDRCYKNAKHGDAYDQLVGLSFDFSKYAQYTATFLPDYIDHFCKNEKPILRLKMRDLTQQMSLCLSKEEKFLPQFTNDTFSYFTAFLCEDHGANIKTFFSSHGKECRNKLSYNNASIELGNCITKISFAKISDKGYAQKKDLCYDVDVMKNCFSGILNKFCPNFRAFEELNKRFFKYMNKPCSACLAHFSYLITMLGVIVALYTNKLF